MIAGPRYRVTVNTGTETQLRLRRYVFVPGKAYFEDSHTASIFLKPYNVAHFSLHCILLNSSAHVRHFPRLGLSVCLQTWHITILTIAFWSLYASGSSSRHYVPNPGSSFAALRVPRPCVPICTRIDGVFRKVSMRLYQV